MNKAAQSSISLESPTISASMAPLVWLITGCSSGFGASLSLTALNAGHKVIATSRNPSKTPGLVDRFEQSGGTWLQLDVNAVDAAHNVREAVKM